MCDCQFFLHLRKELPYSLRQHVRKWKEDDSLIDIELSILTQSRGQKVGARSSCGSIWPVTALVCR